MRMKQLSVGRLWFLRALVLPLIAYLAFSCPKEDPDIVVPTEPQPQQYGTPFDKVPDIADVQMYEVNPRVFSPQKNLDGITARLDSLRQLGVNVVWLMPIYPTGRERSVGSPYAIKDYRSVHPDYGNLTDLRELVDKAHALDMAVMLDWVANHTAWDHAWIADKTWYVTDGSGNIVHPPGTNWQDVAELNYANSKMRLEMIKAMKYWVLEANVDGFRCDYATGVSSTFWKQAIDTLRNIPNRDLLLFAEAEDKALLNAGFDLIFGWPYYGRLKDVFNGLPATQIHNMHLTEYNGLAPGKHVVRWITNHDQHAWEATPQSIFGSVSAATAAFVITSYMGGVPLIYNGQEVATPNQLPFFEGTNATINWNLNPAIKAEYERILNLRKNSAALRRGTLTDYSSSNVAAFVRKDGNEEVLVLVNVRNSNQDFTLPANLRLSDWSDAYSNAPVSLATTVSLGAYQYRVLKR